ncbi:sensor histidine kinase N-terminal domain-containing protein [Luteolibacter ambystomatis]|uniref:histidine kinase n=1 Tax=Luteolibacter ambystomatis TaxID=2824561 RepID=A0A975G7F7_9BACT|nr:ATP-binding protein [Luteolibacter ambystomatis]QUE50198.1 sensor histidine kinase N-terminal domain-containing protein [Luteolibacter ambystomatis]
MNSLKGTLTLRLLLGGIVLLGLAGVAFHWQMRRALTEEFDAALRLTAQSLQAFVEEKGETLKMDSDVDEMPQFNVRRGNTVFLLRRADGQEIRRSLSLGKETLPMAGGTTKEPVYFETKLGDGRKLRCIGYRLEAGHEHEEESGHPGREALLVVGRVRTPLEHTLRELRNSLWIAGGVTLAGMAGLLIWGVRRGLRPLDELVTEISGVTASSLATRFPVEPLPAELQPIAGRLNELLERLAAVFEREKSFTANVAHELRTPLAELRALAEVNLMAPPETADEQAAGWQEVRTVSGRMESLALRLLELARSEEPGRLVRREPVGIPALVDVVWQRHAAAAGGRGITCQREIPAGLVWESDPVLLDLIFTNLIGNAVHHALVDSMVRITADALSIRFANAAPGLTAVDLPNLFERFWKKDAARSDGRRHGLGLALARETAGLLGGTLEARLTGDGVIEFRLVAASSDPE